MPVKHKYSKECLEADLKIEIIDELLYSFMMNEEQVEMIEDILLQATTSSESKINMIEEILPPEAVIQITDVLNKKLRDILTETQTIKFSDLNELKVTLNCIFDKKLEKILLEQQIEPFGNLNELKMNLNNYVDKTLESMMVEETPKKFPNLTEFNEKLAETKKYIEFFNKCAERTTAPDSIFDLKVYFRELFLDKNLGEKMRKSITVMKEYFDNLEKRKTVVNFQNTEEYMFIRAKITRGNYRERDLLEEGTLLYSIQKILAEKLYPIFFSFDYNTIMYDLHNIFCKLSELLECGFQNLIEFTKNS